MFSSLVFSAATNNSVSDDQGSSVTKDFKNAQKLIYSKKYQKAIDILVTLEDKKPIGFSKADLYNYLGFATRKKITQIYKMQKNTTYYDYPSMPIISVLWNI
jgi:hypothetical protein